MMNQMNVHLLAFQTIHKLKLVFEETKRTKREILTWDLRPTQRLIKRKYHEELDTKW